MSDRNYEVREIEYQSKEYDEAFSLRNEILRVPLGLNLYTEDLSREVKSIHGGAFIGNKLVGAMNFYEQPNESGVYYLQQIVVSNDLQKTGIGKTMMKFMENLLKEKGAKTVTMNARTCAQKFYENLGYHIVGEEFRKPGFPTQIRMDKDL